MVGVVLIGCVDAAAAEDGEIVAINHRPGIHEGLRELRRLSDAACGKPVQRIHTVVQHEKAAITGAALEVVLLHMEGVFAVGGEVGGGPKQLRFFIADDAELEIASGHRVEAGELQLELWSDGRSKNHKT